MARHEPLREQAQLGVEAGAIVIRQEFRACGALDPHQGGERVGVQRFRCAAALERVEVGGGPQVGQQQEALDQVGRQDSRRVDRGAAQQSGHGDEAAAVLVLGRRIHRDHRPQRRRAIDPEVAPETRIARGRAQCVELQPGRFKRCSGCRRRLRLQPLQPAAQRFEACIVGPIVGPIVGRILARGVACAVAGLLRQRRRGARSAQDTISRLPSSADHSRAAAVSGGTGRDAAAAGQRAAPGGLRERCDGKAREDDCCAEDDEPW